MKIIRYLLHPLKILVYLMVILSLIYFRTVIFLPNINQYVDTAQLYIENELDISIPVHVNKNIVEAKVDDQAVVEAADTAIDLCNSSTVDLSEATDDIDIVDDVAVVEKFDNVIDNKSDEVAVVEDKNKNEEVIPDEALLVQLTATVNDLNSKVDKLFEAGKSSVNEVLESADSVDALLDVDTKEVSDENLVAVEDVNKNTIKTNVHLTADAKRMFFMARQTYWMGDALGAEQIYLELSAIENDNPDIYGELGNVYYSQGKWVEAGKSYYEAAIRLLALNRNNQVNYLLRVIQGLDSDSAEKLKQKISS